jgi:hypothetical protein
MFMPPLINTRIAQVQPNRFCKEREQKGNNSASSIAGHERFQMLGFIPRQNSWCGR